MSREAMKLALEALENTTTFMRLSDPQYIREYNATVALRAALDAPKPEPIKIITYNCVCGRQMDFESEHGVIAPKRAWVGLTDEDVTWVLQRGDSAERDENGRWHVLPYSFARAIEAKLKEKNT